MSLPDWLNTDKAKTAYLALVVILVGTLGFGLGRLSRLGEGRLPVRIESPAASPVATMGEREASEPGPTAAAGQFVASKNGGKYHLPWCAGAKRIKPENQIWFKNVEEAQKAGYTPAANCPGL